MALKGFSKLARIQEWWEHKLPAVLSIAYATSIFGSVPLIDLGPWLIFLLISITVGGTYVSTINDLTDIEEDLASGKSNRMAKISKKYRWIIPGTCLGFGLLFLYLFLPDKLSAFIYVLPWISFSLYSFKPFRLKQRGIWGLFADASGAHLFIGLLMVSSISYMSHQPVDFLWFFLIGLWSLSFGLRGILWHQYYDRKNDLKIHSTTFATKVPPAQFKKYEKWLFSVEILAFGGILLKISLSLLFVFLGIYILLVFFRYKIMGHKPVIVLNPKNMILQILMLDFYQVFFPLGILIYITYTQKFGWVLLLIHLILFPRKLINILKDSVIILKSIKKRLQASY